MLSKNKSGTGYVAELFVNTQVSCHFPDIFNSMFTNENVWISFTIPWIGFELTIFKHWCRLMVGRRQGDKPLSDPMVVNLLTHICVSRPQWVKCYWHLHNISSNSVFQANFPRMVFYILYFSFRWPHLAVIMVFVIAKCQIYTRWLLKTMWTLNEYNSTALSPSFSYHQSHMLPTELTHWGRVTYM